MDYFSIQLGIIIIPADELIFFRGVGIPPTRIFSGSMVTPSLNHARWQSSTGLRSSTARTTRRIIGTYDTCELSTVCVLQPTSNRVCQIYIYIQYICVCVYFFPGLFIPVHRSRPAVLTILDNPMLSIARVITQFLPL